MDKKLVRYRQGAQLAGVCTGLGAYFGLDPAWVRVGFLVATLAGGPGFLAYLVLWIAMPEEPGAPG